MSESEQNIPIPYLTAVDLVLQKILQDLVDEKNRHGPRYKKAFPLHRHVP